MLRKSWFWRLGAVLAFGACVYACHVGADAVDTSGTGISTPPAGAVPVCGPGRAGCACSGDGLIASCGEVAGNSGDYLTCAMGTSVCEGGVWGACVTKNLVTKNLHKTTLGSGPTHLLQTTLVCPNPAIPLCDDPCDPYDFRVITSDAGDVDSAQIVAVDGGGVSINPVCTDLACQVATNCPAGMPTTLTGTVFDPAGNNPLYNAYVYIPVDPSGALPMFSSGASCDTCAGAGAVPVVADAVTGPDGTFTLTNVPTTDVLPGHAIPLVVQTGKWRRQVMLPSVPKCQTLHVAGDNSRLPRSQSDGFGGHADIPKMAIATGSQDPLQCLLLKMGVDPGEFQLPNTGTRRIDYYVDTGMEFGSGMPAPKSQLVSTLSTLMNYDIVLLPCGGRPATSTLGNFPTDDQYADNVAAYANAGGRVFATHYGLTWLAMPSGTSGSGAGLVASNTNPATTKANPFFGVATWAIDSTSYATTTGEIDTGFTKGAAFSTWMDVVGGSSPPGDIPLTVARKDLTKVNPPATEWIQRDTGVDGGGGGGGEPFYFSFDTPLTAAGDAGAGTCGRVGFADFHVSSTALTDPSGSCNTDQDCGFGSVCNPPVLGTCQPLQCGGAFDCDNGYTCNTAVTTNTCEPAFCSTGADCPSGVCAPDSTGLLRCGCSGTANQAQQCKSGVCLASGVCVPASQGSCTQTRDCGNTEFCSQGATMNGACEKACATDGDCAGERCVNGQCQGCVSDSDCQSVNCIGGTPGTCSQPGTTFPLGCRQVPMTPQEDALEFMLLDLTSCISTGPAMTSVPPTYNSATFTEDFTSSCPAGTRPVWREFDWVDTIPPSAQIDFSAQTTDPPEDGGAVDWTSPELVTIANATVSTAPGGTDFQVLDTGTTGVFNLATPPVLSRSLLRLTVTLLPTTDTKTAPILSQWNVKADCVPAE